MKTNHFYIVAIVILLLACYYFSQASKDSGYTPLPKSYQTLDTIDSVGLPINTLEDKLAAQLSKHYAQRDFAKDALERMEAGGHVDKQVNDLLNQSIENNNLEVSLNKYKGVKYYREDYQQHYTDIEKAFYKEYPYLK